LLRAAEEAADSAILISDKCENPGVMIQGDNCSGKERVKEVERAVERAADVAVNCDHNCASYILSLF